MHDERNVSWLMCVSLCVWVCVLDEKWTGKTSRRAVSLQGKTQNPPSPVTPTPILALAVPAVGVLWVGCGAGGPAGAPFPPGCGSLNRHGRKHDRDKKVEAHSCSSEYAKTWFLLYGYRHGSTVIHAGSPLDMRVYSHQKLHLSLHYLQNIGLGEKMRDES